MRITKLFEEKWPTVSFEFFPPRTDVGRQSLLKVVDRLASEITPDFLSVTYGAGGSTRTLSLDVCREIQSLTSGQVMAHLTCVCHTYAEIDSIVDQLWESGIVNIMALRGDRPKDTDPDAVFGDLIHARDLMAYLRTRHDFCLGGACFPEGHRETPDINVGIEHLVEKVDNGCEFLVTQMFFDKDVYFSFVDKVRAAGINVPVIPGVMPITGFSQLDKFEVQFGVNLPPKLREAVSSREGDESAIEQIGIDWAANQCQALLDGGAPGIHFYTLNRSAATLKVCVAIGLGKDA